MIRNMKPEDIDAVMDIWLSANIAAHSFVPQEYWRSNYAAVKEMLPQAELYLFETNNTIEGFIGISDTYIAGIFVREEAQSKGIGKQLLTHAKACKDSLSLQVYQTNTRAIEFYLREDFIIESESIDEDTGEKEYLMMWRS